MVLPNVLQGSIEWQRSIRVGLEARQDLGEADPRSPIGAKHLLQRWSLEVRWRWHLTLVQEKPMPRFHVLISAQPHEIAGQGTACEGLAQGEEIGDEALVFTLGLSNGEVLLIDHDLFTWLVPLHFRHAGGEAMRLEVGDDILGHHAVHVLVGLVRALELADDLKAHKASALGANAMVALGWGELCWLGAFTTFYGLSDLSNDHGLPLEGEAPQGTHSTDGHLVWMGAVDQDTEALFSRRGTRCGHRIGQLAIGVDSIREKVIQSSLRETGLTCFPLEDCLRIKRLRHGRRPSNQEHRGIGVWSCGHFPGNHLA